MNEQIPVPGRRREPASGPHGELGVAVDVDEREDHVLVKVHGVIDFWSAGPLQEQVNWALQGRRPHLVFDLQEVTFVDSTGLGLLVSVHRRAETGGGWLHLARPSPQLRRVLEATNLDRFFHLYADVGSATGDA
ncbi:STAS domain-containing protein [Micromonospora sp. CPCC 205371]|nr:STAS domain-containing protein [Micromonospora sp. CPCC 205371]